MSTRSTAVRTALTLAATLVAVLAGSASASAGDGPVLGAAGGCALQCIEQALVTTTSTAARVEVKTSVPTRIVMSARRLSATGGLVAAPPDATATSHVLRATRLLFLVALQPETTYRIVVSATDAAGHTATRSGAFATKPVEVNVDPGPGGLSSGLGCSAQCIQKAVPVAIGPTAAVFEIGTDTPARIKAIVSTADTNMSSTSSPGLTTSWTTTATPLDPGTKYTLTIRATDASGRVNTRTFSFKTRERQVRVTFWKVKVIDDGDKGRARGELSFEYWAGGRLIRLMGFHKRSSGDVFSVTASGTSRPGLSVTLPANGPDPKLDLRVYAEECDGSTMKNCVSEAHVDGGLPTGGGEYGGNDTATAGGLFSLGSILTGSTLPPNFGTSMPEGHNGYFTFETTQYHVKFRVYAFADVIYG